MKYPKINKQPRREVSVPELSGGLNFRDSLTGIRDNQLTDCVNMWYRDGMLKTRPAFSAHQDSVTDTVIERATQVNCDLKMHSEITNDEYVLMSMSFLGIDANAVANAVIVFWWQSKTEKKGLSYLKIPISVSKFSFFLVSKDGVAFCYLNCIKEFYIFKYDFKSNDIVWTQVDDDEIYSPIVLAHCKTTASEKVTENEVLRNGVLFEGYNLLGKNYRILYSTVNPDLLEDETSTHKAVYGLLNNVLDGKHIGEKVKVKITDIEGNTYTHSVTIKATDRSFADEIDVQDDGMRMQVTRKYIIFYDENNQVKQYKSEEYVEDNMEITLPSANSILNREKVFKMTQSTWFGGLANGIGGGSRVFLCGNSTQKNCSLVLWSGLNNPLYFNENNYAYIGNKAQPTVAFGKQGENLIIFKPNETYYTYYCENDKISGDDLIRQTVVDYEANSVFFPIITLHSTIGCDCPSTIQLCRNRLVWLNSNGKIYTLVSNNQFSERTIYEVSGMVEKALKNSYTAEELKKAVSGDVEGHYVLIVNNDAYVMNYNSYGYTNVASYTKSEDANALIPWYHWKLLPEDNFEENEKLSYYCNNDCIYMACFKRTEDNKNRICSGVLIDNNDNTKDEYMKTDGNGVSVAKSSIFSKFRTKLFDFSLPHQLKNIEKVSIILGKNEGIPINVSFETNVGSEMQTVEILSDSTSITEVNYITSKTLYPCMRAVRIFGIAMESEGKLVVDGISIQYRLLGGVK